MFSKTIYGHTFSIGLLTQQIIYERFQILTAGSFLPPGMAIYFMYGVHNSKEGLTGDSQSRDFLQRLTGSTRDVRTCAGSSSDEEPLSPSSDGENDEGFQSNLMTSEDESPKHTLIRKEEDKGE